MSNTQKKNVPELRFPEFEGEWEEKKLGDTLEFIKDGTHGTHENVNNGPWLLSAKNIKNNKIVISSDDRKISESDYKKIYKNYKLEKGDLLLTIVGTIGRAAIVKNPNNIAFQRSVAILKTKATYDVEFIFQLFQTKYFKNLLLRKQVVSAQPGLYLGDIRKIKISIKNIIEEQRKIGTFFRKIDRQIELEEQKLELLQQQKKGYMQKIFSQELRFKDENGNDYPDWEEKQLGELSQIVRGASPRPIKDPKWFNKESDIGWLRISDVTNQNGKIYHLEQKLSIEGQEKTRVLVTTHLLLSIAASIGKPVMNFVKTGVHDGFLIFLNPKFNLFFMYYWLEYFKDKWSKYGQPGSQVNLNTEIVKSQTLNMPSNHEQEKVGQFFNRNEKLIELQQEKIMYLKRRKQVLLQKMFI
ncbi:restriction endonuclease subunit S [Staphylococcus aureus]|uniref:restriction endonuclease subunit S n=1 Tax=Staphylococcus aureus TaxID=1280 RepID=UPI000E3ECCD2|nr:restriction endonuclease subunit S [Staphylococcus aureus]GBW96541.1 type I restriction modification DNA specificity protein [Staphylococcus aureus]GCA42122.1 type I restriction modification DNA specificity protein [Staphylococcus aureus]